MSTYNLADSETYDLLADALTQFHGAKADAGIPIKIIMAHPPKDEAGDATGPAIRVKGFPAVACIRILSLKDRVAYGVAAEMQLDADHWDESANEERIAILDHELTHLELKVNEDGSVKRDDAGMPLLRKREHDREYGFFDVVAHRHGEFSEEVKQCRAFLESEHYRQCYMFDLEEALNAD
jgi:hypothetical protein